MRILHVCSEFYPLLKTGGLADVVGALPLAQQKLGDDARVLIPGYPVIMENVVNKTRITQLRTFAGEVTLYYGEYGSIPLYIIDAPHLYHREGSPYHDMWHNAYQDNHIRFALLGWVASELTHGCDAYWKAEVVHAHDWHAGLACAYLKATGSPAKSVFTIHNIAFQGVFSAHHMAELWLPSYMLQTDGLEFWGQISFMKAGLFYADHITTVSPTYAQEILNPEFAYGFEGLLRQRQHEGRLSGILNGIDTDIWSPQHDGLIPQNYTTSQLKRKLDNKYQLQKQFGLEPQNGNPLFIAISRLSYQKGLDLILEILPTLVSSGAQFILLGNGDHYLEEAFRHAEATYPDKVKCYIGYNETLSHQLMAGGDVLMVPSRFEPCGLTQLYALRYGTLPLVRSTGGLADTVTDCSLEALASKQATGFVFYHTQREDMERALQRALTLWKTPTKWRQVQKNAMSQDVSWARSAGEYQGLYRYLLNY